MPHSENRTVFVATKQRSGWPIAVMCVGETLAAAINYVDRRHLHVDPCGYCMEPWNHEEQWARKDYLDHDGLASSYTVLPFHTATKEGEDGQGN